MSQVTRCPVCSTQFKIQPEQLKISEGWVRCGKCNEIFDASEHFVEAPATPPAAQPDHASLNEGAAHDDPQAARKQSLEDLIARVQRRLDNALAGTSTTAAVAAADLEARLRANAAQAADANNAEANSADANGAATSHADADTAFSPPPFDTAAAQAAPAPAPAPVSAPITPPVAPPVAAPSPAPGEELRVTDKWQQDLSYTFAPSRPSDLSELDDLARATQASHGGDRVEIFEPAVKEPLSTFQTEVEDWRARNAATADTSGVVSYGLHKSGDAQAISEQVAQAQAQEVQADAAALDREQLYQPSPTPPADESQEAAETAEAAEPEAQTQEDAHFRVANPNLPPAQQLQDEVDNPETEGLSFVRHAEKRAFWRKKSVRLGLGVVALALGAALAVQMAVQNSQQLAARSPQMKGWMQTLCSYANCSTAPLQDIQSLVIDSSSFQIVAPNTYELAWAVKNQAASWVQAPSLEVNLLNSRQGVLVRRVLTPAELGDVRELAPHQLWSLKQGLEVSADVGDVVGYRLQLIYP